MNNVKKIEHKKTSETAMIFFSVLSSLAPTTLFLVTYCHWNGIVLFISYNYIDMATNTRGFLYLNKGELLLIPFSL
jgi:hypothetical protein